MTSILRLYSFSRIFLSLNSNYIKSANTYGQYPTCTILRLTCVCVCFASYYHKDFILVEFNLQLPRLMALSFPLPVCTTYSDKQTFCLLILSHQLCFIITSLNDCYNSTIFLPLPLKLKSLRTQAIYTCLSSLNQAFYEIRQILSSVGLVEILGTRVVCTMSIHVIVIT